MTTTRLTVGSLPEVQERQHLEPFFATKPGRDGARSGRLRWSLNGEQAYNILPVCLLSLCGHLPSGVPQSAVLAYGALIAIFTGLPFLLNRARLRLDLVAVRISAMLFGWMLLSALWSPQPLKVNAPLMCELLCIFLYLNYLLDRFSTQSLARVLLYAYTLMLFLSVVVVVAAPGIGIDSGAETLGATSGAWQGMFQQKNILGLACLIAFAVVLAVRSLTPMDRLCRWTLLLLSTVCAIKSQSRETWASFLIAFALFLFLKTLRKLKPSTRFALVLVTCFLVVGVAVALVTNLDAVLTLLGRDRTASGRTQVWDAVLLAFKMRPWLGYGLLGFWPTPYASIVQDSVGWPVTTSHNEILEALVNYGVFGTAILGLTFAAAWGFLVRVLLRSHLLESGLHIYLAAGFLVMGTSSVVLLWLPSIALVLFLFGMASVEKAGRLPRPAPLTFRGVANSHHPPIEQAA